tara:strand:+ start:531 stop:923 length:393 start_codon:yes stop_codon:yes gene_type:complete
MTTHVYTDQQLLDGLNRYRRLQKTVPVRTRDEALPFTFTKEARALRRGLPHWHPDNIQAAILYAVEGGWNADIVLRDAPHGQPLILGKGTGQPFTNRAQAEKFLLDFVTALTAAWAPEAVLPTMPKGRAA